MERILYEMLTGGKLPKPRPFQGTDQLAIAQHNNWAGSQDPTFTEESLNQFPSKVRNLLRDMGKKNHKARISSYDEITRIIEDILING